MGPGTMEQHFTLNQHRIGRGAPTYIVAEMSANHGHDFDKAARIVEAAASAGANAIKLQTYTPDTLTINCDNGYFRIKSTPWGGRNLYDLYGEAYTPWEWQPKLKELAEGMRLDFFSTPFDETAVDFLEEMNVPAFKVASFELVDLPLLRRIAVTGKPIIASTGMASLAEIEEAVRTMREAGTGDLALLKCTSSYPAPADEMNLRTIPHLAESFQVPVGLSDHTLGNAVPVAAVALGACIIEKHFTLSRSDPGPDSAFSLEPAEFKGMVDAIRTVERALGEISYGLTEREIENRVFRRSLFVVQDMQAGDFFTQENVRSIRPGYGLHTRYLNGVIGKRASREIESGTPLDWIHISAS
jgi:pseudaminic acid synthase